MEKVYNDTPDNFEEIKPYIITVVSEIAEEMIQASKCFFYDACAFRNHMNISQPEAIFEYIKQSDGVVVIVRSIIMELCSNDNSLWREHIAYIRKMYRYGIKVLVMYEEDCYDILNTCYAGVANINRMLTYAVMNTKSKAGVIERVFASNPEIEKEMFANRDNKDSSLAQRFFQKVRGEKASGDDMGETLIAVCVHMLANIRELHSYKYVVFTDDKGAVTLLGKVMKNVAAHIGNKCVSAVTTQKLCWLMVQENVTITQQQMRDIVNSVSVGDMVTVYCSEKYELEANEKKMMVEEFVRKVMGKSGVKVYL